MYLFRKYLKDISKHGLIDKNEEIELSKKIMDGDKPALQKMINSNLKLVVKISLEYYRGTISLMDIIQNGNMGLMKAAKKFDHHKGVKFSTYAAFWIRQSILRGFIKPSHCLNISYRKDTINKRIKEFIHDFITDNHHYPTVDDITGSMKVSRRDAVDMLFYYKNSEQSLNETAYTEGDELIESVPDEKFNPEKVIEEESMLKDVYEAIDSFSEREREIIRKRFGFDEPQRETLQRLGVQFSITAEAARQIEKRVLHNLKNRFPALSYYFYT